MSALIQLPRDLVRSARAAVYAALAIADPDTGEVDGGMAALHDALGHDDEGSTRRAVAAAESWGFLRRVHVRGSAPHLYVVRARMRNGGHCALCLEPSKAGRFCAKCKQVAGRDDRKWQLKAIVLAVEGKSPPEISVAVNRPLWTTREEDGDQGSAVVPFLLAEAPWLLKPDAETWRRALLEATNTGERRTSAQPPRFRSERRRGSA